jgi:hypothetical protein
VSSIEDERLRNVAGATERVRQEADPLVVYVLVGEIVGIPRDLVHKDSCENATKPWVVLCPRMLKRAYDPVVLYVGESATGGLKGFIDEFGRVNNQY